MFVYTLKPTATGLDGLPAWYLRIGAPVFYKPLAFLFNQSVASSTVPTQWKHAYICPVPKVPQPRSHNEFRPISITPVLTRIIERTFIPGWITHTHLYRSVCLPFIRLHYGCTNIHPPYSNSTSVQQPICHVIVVALHFTKAFDTVQQETLLRKLAQLNIHDSVYNWMMDFFGGHTHCTKFSGPTSASLPITASVIQGSAIGPASFVVNAADLKPVTAGNSMAKYADDTYLIVPAINVGSRTLELDNIDEWAKANNLTLNRSKSAEIVIIDRKRKCHDTQPSSLPDIRRVSTIKILGVTISNKLSVNDHVSNIVSKCSQTLCALTILRAHGLCDTALQAVFRSVAITRLLYACSAWWGYS